MERYELIKKIRNTEKINIVFKGGRFTVGRVMCVFDCELTDSVYIIFTDDTKNDAGLYNAYAAKFNILTGLELEIVNGQKAAELEMINNVIRSELSHGIFKKKPICELHVEKIAEVYFDVNDRIMEQIEVNAVIHRAIAVSKALVEMEEDYIRTHEKECFLQKEEVKGLMGPIHGGVKSNYYIDEQVGFLQFEEKKLSDGMVLITPFKGIYREENVGVELQILTTTEHAESKYKNALTEHFVPVKGDVDVFMGGEMLFDEEGKSERVDAHVVITIIER